MGTPHFRGHSHPLAGLVPPSSPPPHGNVEKETLKEIFDLWLWRSVWLGKMFEDDFADMCVSAGNQYKVVVSTQCRNNCTIGAKW